MRCTLPCLLLLATLTSCSCGAAPTPADSPGATNPQALAPFDYINGQLIDLDTGVKLYRLTGLKSSTGYEVRVSFPASVGVPPLCAGTASLAALHGCVLAALHCCVLLTDKLLMGSRHLSL